MPVPRKQNNDKIVDTQQAESANVAVLYEYLQKILRIAGLSQKEREDASILLEFLIWLKLECIQYNQCPEDSFLGFAILYPDDTTIYTFEKDIESGVIRSPNKIALHFTNYKEPKIAVSDYLSYISQIERGYQIVLELNKLTELSKTFYYDGNVGCMVNGAGLAMATMDIIKLAGGEPANFLDVGGTANKTTVANGFKIILSDPNVKAILINIFGGIVRCDRVAQGVIDAASEMDINVPIVVRLEGTNAVEAGELLNKSELNFEVASSLKDAADKVTAILKK